MPAPLFLGFYQLFRDLLIMYGLARGEAGKVLPTFSLLHQKA